MNNMKQQKLLSVKEGIKLFSKNNNAQQNISQNNNGNSIQHKKKINIIVNNNFNNKIATYNNNTNIKSKPILTESQVSNKNFKTRKVDDNNPFNRTNIKLEPTFTTLNRFKSTNKFQISRNLTFKNNSINSLFPSQQQNFPRKNTLLRKNLNITEIFLKKTSSKQKNNNNDTFCSAFFISSFSANGNVVENSENYVADCGHDLCSKLPAMEPEILYKYPLEDSKEYDINDLSASICFPNGIKICYQEDETNVNTYSNFGSILTNQEGKRYFLMTLHFYHKILNIDFFNQYNMYPIKHEFAKYTDEYYEKLNEEDKENYPQKLEMYTKLNFHENIYVPFCLCLISKYPYFNQMFKCLESIRIFLSELNITKNNLTQSLKEVKLFIEYLIKSIPVPVNNTKVSFCIPFYDKLIEIQKPNYKDILFYGDNNSILLDKLPIELIIIIFKLLIFEQKILLIGNNYDNLAQISFNFISLLYPFKWGNTYISIMSEQMLKYLESFLPFFNGLHYSLYKSEKTQNILRNATENIYIININQKSVEINKYPNIKGNKANFKKINEILPNLPKNIESKLNLELGVLKSYYEKKKLTKDFKDVNNILNLNIKIKQVFIQVFIELLYDYENYLSIIDKCPIFNINGLLEKRPKNESEFYKEFTQTQLFLLFIQNNYKNKDTFFISMVNEYLKLKDKNNFRKVFEKKCLKYCQIDKNYIITPYFLEENISKFLSNNKKKELEINDLENILEEANNKYAIFFSDEHSSKNKIVVIKDKISLNVLNNNNDKNKIYNYYQIPDSEIQQNDLIEESDEEDKVERQYKRRYTKNGLELSNIEKYDIKESIVDFLTKVYKNEFDENIQIDKKILLNSLNSSYGRELFINNLFENNNVIINEKSYKFLEVIIFNCLLSFLKLELNENNLLYCMKLVKSCSNFKKYETNNKNVIFLSDTIYPKLHDFRIVNITDFWKKWVETDVNIKETDKNNKDQKYFMCLENIHIIMGKMKLKKGFILSVVGETAKEKIENQILYSLLMKKIVENLIIIKSKDKG